MVHKWSSSEITKPPISGDFTPWNRPYSFLIDGWNSNTLSSVVKRDPGWGSWWLVYQNQAESSCGWLGEKNEKKPRQKRYLFGKPWSDDWIYIGFSCRLPLPRVQIWEISSLTPISWGSMLLLQLIWSPCDFSFHFGLLRNPVYFAMININHDLSNSRLINQFIVQRNSCGAPSSRRRTLRFLAS